MTPRRWIGLGLLMVAAFPVAAAAQMSLLEPGLISTREHDDLTPTFSPDGRHLVFVRREPGATFTLYESFRTDEGWSDPDALPFSGTAPDLAPYFSPDGRWLFFQSRRGTLAGARDDDLWRVRIDDGEWGEPEPVPPPVRRAPPAAGDLPFEGREMAPSVAADGTLLYWSALPGMTLGQSDIYFAPPEGEGYGDPRNLGEPVNTEAYETHPWISPDGSYLLFSCDRCADAVGASDVYVSRREADGWTTPVNLGAPVNSGAYDFGALVSLDGRFLYVSSNRPVPGRPGEPVQNIWRIPVAEVPALSFLESPPGAPDVRVEYLGNEGVLIEGGGTGVLVDGLFGEGLEAYARVPPPRRDSLERALGRYGDIDIVMVTHVHRDHFEARAVARHLRANPGAAFVGPRQAVDSLDLLAAWTDPARTFVVSSSPGESVVVRRPELTVEAVGLAHPPSRNQPVEHVVYQLTVAGVRVLHMGDSAPRAGEVAGLPRSPDLLLAPFWVAGDSAVIAALAPRRVAAFHYPTGRDHASGSRGNGPIVERLRVPGQVLRVAKNFLR